MDVFLSKNQRQRHYRNLRIKIYLWTGLILLVAIFGIYGAFKLPFLQIKEFSIGSPSTGQASVSSGGVSGRIDLEAIKAEVLKNKIAQFLGVDNFLSWPEELGGILVKKDYFNGVLELSAAVSLERFIIWCSSLSTGDSACYWVNRGGVVVETAPETEGSAIFKVNDSREAALIGGKEVLDKKLFGNLVKIINGLAGLPIGIVNLSFNERLQELAANGTKGEKIIFSLRFAPAEKAFTYLKELASSGKLRSSEYVDLTVENRIYLKPL